MSNLGPKWLPKEFQTSYHLFDELVEIEKLSKILCIRSISEMDTNEPDFTVSFFFFCFSLHQLIFRVSH